MGEVKNIPKLRFPDFQDLWSQNKLINLTDKISDGIHSTPKYDENGHYYFVNGNNLVDGKIQIFSNTKRVNDAEFEKHRRNLNDNTILISINGTIGNLALYSDEKIVLGKSACYINLKIDLPKYFYYSILQTYKVKRHFYSELTGTTIKNLSLKTIKALKLNLPTLPEQTKIANFLTAVDTKIATLTKKKTLLEQYKKGVMQQIFSQQLRFKQDDGSDYPDWERKRLGEVCDCLDNKREPINSVDREKIQGTYPYWGANNIMDYINKYIFDETIVLLAEDGGNFNDFKTRPIANISHGKCWVNNHTHVLRGQENKILNQYLFYSLVHKNITGFVSGGTRSKLIKSEMLKIPLIVPSIEEQTKIANFLTALDQKITQTESQIEKTKTFKKGLLQQMFV